MRTTLRHDDLEQNTNHAYLLCSRLESIAYESSTSHDKSKEPKKQKRSRKQYSQCKRAIRDARDDLDVVRCTLGTGRSKSCPRRASAVSGSCTGGPCLVVGARTRGSRDRELLTKRNGSFMSEDLGWGRVGEKSDDVPAGGPLHLGVSGVSIQLLYRTARALQENQCR